MLTNAVLLDPNADGRFIREDDEEDTASLSYDDTVALKYYKSLFKEYACCDLKHYKRGEVSEDPFDSFVHSLLNDPLLDNRR